MTSQTFPPIPKALLDELEQRFPDRMPLTRDGADIIRIKQGQVDVVRFLRHHYDLQNKTILENH